mgnify:FL=1
MLIHYEASVIGPSHKLQGRSNQDCHCVRVVEVLRTEEEVDTAESRETPAAPTPGRAIVAAVADGVSSMILSGEGAHLASEAAVDAAAEAFVRGELVPGDASALKDVYERALRAVADAAANEPAADIASFACTLCVVVWDGAHVWYGNAGDSGAIAVDVSGAPFALAHLHRGPLSCQVFPLHDTYHWEFGFAAGAAGVLMATDGMLEKFAAWEPGAYGAPTDFNREAIDLFMACDIDADDVPALCGGAADYLRALPATCVDDDKTVVALINCEGDSLADDVEEEVEDVTAERLATTGVSFADADGDLIVLPWRDELRMRAGDVARAVGGSFSVELEYQLMCGAALDRALELATAAAAERAETYRVFEDCVIGEPDDFEAVAVTGDDTAFDEME